MTIQSFQNRVGRWLRHCFGRKIADDTEERIDRFLEEALELAQAIGYDPARAHALVDYVFGRPVGNVRQEIGGTYVTLAALCHALRINGQLEAETELSRVCQPDIIRRIAEKQKAKPVGSALPIKPSPDQAREAMLNSLALRIKNASMSPILRNLLWDMFYNLRDADVRIAKLTAELNKGEGCVTGQVSYDPYQCTVKLRTETALAERRLVYAEIVSSSLLMMEPDYRRYLASGMFENVYMRLREEMLPLMAEEIERLYGQLSKHHPHAFPTPTPTEEPTVEPA